MYFIGYDVGNAQIKAALIEGDSRKVIEEVQYPKNDMRIISKRPGWAEQEPELWWMHFCMATRKLLSKAKDVNPEDIGGIGLAYQMHGLVLIDADGQVLRPSIIWCDSRAVSIGDQAFHNIGERYCLENFLNSPGNFTASRLKWIKDNEPNVYQQIDKVMLPGDYLAFKLTGEKQTTISGLSEAILWNFKERRKADEVLEYFGLSDSLFPDCIPTQSIQGRVTQEAADLTGLASGTPLSYRAGDQPNNALSLNVLNPGEVAATSDTSGVVYGIMDTPTFDSESRVNAFAHVNYEENYDRIGILLCINGAGTLYHWMKSQVAHHDHDYAKMEKLAASVPVGSEGLLVIPFGNGAERMLNNTNVNAHLSNLQLNRHKRPHMYRAGLEGVAFAFAQGVNILKEMGLSVDILRVGNDNMFQSKVFATTISTLLNCEIEVKETNGAVGAAYAAGVSVGFYADYQEALANLKTNKVHEPASEAMPYQAAFQKWSYELALHSEGQNELSPDQSPALQKHVESLQADNILKDKELAHNTLELISQKELLKEISNELSKIKQGQVSPKKIRDLSVKIDKQLTQSKKADSVAHYFDIIHNDFFRHLRSQYPTLTHKDVELSSLIKMQLSTKEIAERLMISNRGVETRRFRLRKKLGLEANQRLNEFLDKM